MTQPLPDPVFVILCDDEGAGRIVVDLEAFARFGTHMDVSLAELEAKWPHRAPAGRRRALRPSSQTP
jgi:hypothetical protein